MYILLIFFFFFYIDNNFYIKSRLIYPLCYNFLYLTDNSQTAYSKVIINILLKYYNIYTLLNFIYIH